MRFADSHKNNKIKEAKPSVLDTKSVQSGFSTNKLKINNN